MRGRLAFEPGTPGCFCVVFICGRLRFRCYFRNENIYISLVPAPRFLFKWGRSYGLAYVRGAAITSPAHARTGPRIAQPGFRLEGSFPPLPRVVGDSGAPSVISRSAPAPVLSGCPSKGQPGRKHPELAPSGALEDGVSCWAAEDTCGPRVWLTSCTRGPERHRETTDTNPSPDSVLRFHSCPCPPGQVGERFPHDGCRGGVCEPWRPCTCCRCLRA